MGGTRVLRAAFLASGTLAAMAFGGSLANAQNASAPGADAATASRIDFTDPSTPLPEGVAIDFSVREDAATRFAPIEGPHDPDAQPQRRLELELAAGGGDSPLDVSISQRASLGADRNGDVDRQGRGSEVRVGRGLVPERDGTSSANSAYVFVASDNEALTWQPGSRTEFGSQGSSFAMQDRVEVGDLSAGVTYERGGVQASLAYVEREEATRVGNQVFSQDQSFTGVTLTMRR